MDFKEQKKYIEANRSVDVTKFSSVKDVTNMIDLINNEVKKKAEDRATEDINSISALLWKINHSKSFVIGGKRG